MSETKLPNTPVTEEAVRKLAGEWASFMQITTPFEIQFGDFAGLPEEAKATGDEFGVTFGYPDDKFIVCISDKCPKDRLEQVIVHELVHVHTFAQSGPDERAAMEVATELAADLTRQLRASFEETNAAEQAFDTPTSCANEMRRVARIPYMLEHYRDVSDKLEDIATEIAADDD